jgi:hypothetical protein
MLSPPRRKHAERSSRVDCRFDMSTLGDDMPRVASDLDPRRRNRSKHRKNPLLSKSFLALPSIQRTEATREGSKALLRFSQHRS